MTPFTDDDLNLLRKCAHDICYSHTIKNEKLQALIARMETAEILVDACRIYHGDALKIKPELIDAHCKAAGKNG